MAGARGRRERIDPRRNAPGGSGYVRRDAQGQFTTDQTGTGRSVGQDRRIRAKHSAPKGQKDRGD